ncbi:hypothetical protein [Candidatus Vidania fulgoroideorum]
MILLNIIKNKIKEVKNSNNKLNINILKYLCYKKKQIFIKKNKYPNIFYENKFFSPIKGLIKKENIYYFIKKIIKKKNLSILTDFKYFSGHNIFINIIKKIKNFNIIKKDFIFEKYQLYENLFSNNISLLIYKILRNKIKNFLKFLKFFKMKYILELKSKNEIKKIYKKKYINKYIGINNRNLDNFVLSYKKIENIINKYNNLISESGIKNKNFIYKYFNRGIKNFLVGENLFKNFNNVIKRNQKKDY